MAANLAVCIAIRNHLHTTVRSIISIRPTATKRPRVWSSPGLESLETRALLSTFLVSTTLDMVAIDLRTGKNTVDGLRTARVIVARHANVL